MSGILKSSDKTLDLLRNSSACASGVSTIMAALDIFQGKPKPTLGSSLGTSVSSNDDTITFTGTGTLDKKTVDQYSSDKTIKKVIINGFKKIEKRAFSLTQTSDWTQLTSINLDSSVKTIGNNAFYCPKLTSINLDSVKIIDSKAFYSCYALTTINLDSVETIGKDAFSACNALKTISIGNSVETIGKDAFFECTALTKVIISDETAKILNEEWSSPSPEDEPVSSFYGSTYTVRFILP